MTKKVNRRTFILLTLTSSLSLYMSGWWFFKVRNNDASDIIATIVSKKLDYLQLDPTGLQQFAEDFSKNQINKELAQQLSWKGMFNPLFKLTDLLDSVAAIDVYGEIFAQLFLLSSDFFWQGSDETRIVKYVSLYNPYTRPCSNPFAILTD